MFPNMDREATAVVRKGMKKWRIVLEVEEKDNLRNYQNFIRECCGALSAMPKLRHLTISIQDQHEACDPRFCLHSSYFVISMA
jgi:hypothetical protein